MRGILLLGINGIIGAGIYLLPYKIYREVGVSSILVTIVGALVVISLALCYAEAASKFTQNGASYLYAKTAFGNLAGFEVGFYTWIVGVLGWATQMSGFLLVVQSIFPPLKDDRIYDMTALGICFFLAFINYLGLKYFQLFNSLFSIGKLVPLILFVGIGIFFMNSTNFIPFIPPIVEGESYFNHFGAAFSIIFYAYLGFEFLPIAAGEMENPEKNLPRAIVLVVTFSAIFYTLITMVCIGILGKGLEDIAVPVAKAAEMVLGEIGYNFIILGSMFAIGGICWSCSFNAPIIAATLADNGFLPRVMGKKSRFGTPGVAILLTTLVVAYLVISGTFMFLAGVTVVAAFVQYIFTALSIPFLRKNKTLPKSYTVPGGIAVPAFAVIVSIVLLSQAGTKTLLYGLSGLVIGAGIYYAYGKRNMR